MNNVLKYLISGIFIWIICFGIGFIAFPLHESQLLLFKTIMILSSIFVGMVFLSKTFTKINNNYIQEGMLLGFIWFFINIGLDLIVLVGMFKSQIREYFIGTGLRYIAMPIMSIGIGNILEKNRVIV